MLNRLLRLASIGRETLRIDNCVRCQPPGNWLDGAPWEHQALAYCRQYLDVTLREGAKAAVAAGGSATRHLLSLPKRDFKINNWHGCPTQDARGLWVIPTFHPAFLLRGNQKLIGTTVFDLRRALEVAERGWEQDEPELVVDPGPSWFEQWVTEYLAALGDGTSAQAPWLAVDIETENKLGAEEDELEEDFGQITRINFACRLDEGVTVPWEAAYLPGIGRLLGAAGVKCFWNARFDVPRLRAAGMLLGEPILDFMWAWHVLQSDLPRGLGFVAPFYSTYGAWKHLSGADPGRYAALDAVQTLRCAFGIARGLESQGQWDAFRRHVYELDTKVLHPAEAVGLQVDKERLQEFKEQLLTKEEDLRQRLAAAYPPALLELHPPEGWARRPEGPKTVKFSRGEQTVEVVYQPEEIVEVASERLVNVCITCGAVEVAKSHKCKTLQQQWLAVPRYFVREPFNPASPPQVLKYLQSKGHKAGRAKKKKTDDPSVDKKTLEALARSTKDPFYQLLLDYRAVAKVRGTYVEGAERRMDADGRLHTSFLHVPSTLRLSSQNPNLQNVTGERAEGVATGFRRCIVAAPGCLLVEADFSAIEAVLTGWFIGDPNFIRLAKLGIHAYHAGHVLGMPADLGWDDGRLGEHFKQVKAFDQQHSKGVLQYDKSKRTIYGTLYGMSAPGLQATYPELFPSRKAAEASQRLLFELCPKLKEWHAALRTRAARQGYLGGSDHPFGYKHWFWDVVVYDSRAGEWRLGADAKRVVAFYPQSAAAGIIKDAALRLVEQGPWDCRGLGPGPTPIRALIHDSILLEVYEKRVKEAVARLVGAMELPVAAMGGLQVGVAVKVGRDWGAMDKWTEAAGVSGDLGSYEEIEEAS